jgi:hypothetical protein
MEQARLFGVRPKRSPTAPTSRLEEGLAELRKILDPVKLDYPFYPAAQGEFHLLAGRPAEARKHFEKALELARSRCETNFFERKLKSCQLEASQINEVDHRTIELLLIVNNQHRYSWLPPEPSQSHAKCSLGLPKMDNRFQAP